PRCAQIATFNLALTAWKLGGYQELPTPHLACSGLAPRATESQWVALAGEEDRLKHGMARLYALFRDAPVLGSLIDPIRFGGHLLRAESRDLQPLLDRALSIEPRDENMRQMVITAHGIAKAADILASHFTLIVTNVPYLGSGKQTDSLKEYCE